MHRSRYALDNASLRAGAVIAACFLLTSVGYLAWLYRLMELAPLKYVDLASMVTGYLFQALGTGIYSSMLHGRSEEALRRPTIALSALFSLLLAPIMLVDSLVAILVFGYVANAICGYIAGYYLHVLAQCVSRKQRGLVFGCGYALATVLTWLVSLPATGTFLQTSGVLALCGVCTVACALVIVWPWEPERVERKPNSTRGMFAALRRSEISILSLAIPAILLMCMVKNLGNGFPATDLDSGVNLEFSRLLYAVSLVIAGIASDRNLKYGLICCMAALVMPFITLSLAGTPVPGVMLWGLGYFFYGFFSVFRVVLFADLSDRYDCPELSGWGLMVGHVGDSLGTALCLALAPWQFALVMATALLFAATVFLSFKFYQMAYEARPSAHMGPTEAPAAITPRPLTPARTPATPASTMPALATPASPPAPDAPQAPAIATPAPEAPSPRKSERQLFEEFATTYAITARERDVLRLVLLEQSNSEIAAELFVSEGTVKFHVRNLLKKTGCKNRLELIAKFVREATSGD